MICRACNDTVKSMTEKYLPHIYGRAIVIALCLLPVLAAQVPRLMGPGPPLIAAAGIAAYYYYHRTLPPMPRHALFWALAVPGLMALSAVWSIDQPMALGRAAKTLPIILSAPGLMTLAKVLDDKAVRDFYRFFPVAIMITGALCAIELYNHAPLYHALHVIEKPMKRFNYSPLNRSIVVFTLSSFVAFFCVAYGPLEKRARLLVLLALAAVITVTLPASVSQSAQLAFILGVAVFFLFPAQHAWVWRGVAIVLAALMALTPWLTQWMFHHFASAAAQASWLHAGYIPYRLEIWDFVSRRALERPFFGFGVEATREITDFDTAKLYHPTTEVLHPHNFAVQLWIEFGAIGAAFGAAFLADLLECLRLQPMRERRLLLAVFIACLSVAATGYGLWQSWWLGLFCFLAGIGVLALRDGKEKTS